MKSVPFLQLSSRCVSAANLHNPFTMRSECAAEWMKEQTIVTWLRFRFASVFALKRFNVKEQPIKSATYSINSDLAKLSSATRVWRQMLCCYSVQLLPRHSRYSNQDAHQLVGLARRNATTATFNFRPHSNQLQIGNSCQWRPHTDQTRAADKQHCNKVGQTGDASRWVDAHWLKLGHRLKTPFCIVEEKINVKFKLCFLNLYLLFQVANWNPLVIY